MKGFLKILGGVVLVLILGAAIVGFLFWSRVPDMISDHLSAKMRVSVTIDDIHLSLNNIRVDRFVIGNPSGSILPKAFSAKTIDVHAPVMRYLDEKIVIDEIDIDKIYLGLEFDSASGTKGNWTEIMQNMQSSPSSSSSSNRSVLIKKLVLTNISTDLVYRKGDRSVKHLKNIDRMEFTNISSENGIPLDQLANSVLGQMLKSVFVKENLKNMIENVVPNPIKEPGKFIDTFKGVFGH